MSQLVSIEGRVARGVIALAVGTSLLGCRGWKGGGGNESKARESDAVKEGSSICDNDQIFGLGQEITLGENPDGDYTATLAVGKSPSLRTFTLILDLEDGTRFSPAGGSLPKSGETVTTGWGSYIEVEIANCGGVFYHYRVNKLAGAEARPIKDPACIPADYAKEGLKPWPFVDRESVYVNGAEEVFIASASVPEIYLIRLMDGVVEDSVAVRRLFEGETISGLIAVTGGKVTVEVVNCSGSYFFKSEFRPTVAPLPPGWIDWQ